MEMKTGWLVCAISAALLWGCDKKNEAADKVEVKPPPATAPAIPKATTRPTTQALLDGPRKSVVLGALPLRMNVPESWKIEKSGDSSDKVVADQPSGGGTNSYWLDGPTPGGTVHIQLVANPISFTSETVALRGKKAERDAAASSGAITVIPLHKVGAAAQVMERRETFDGKVRGFDGEPMPAKMMDWTVEVYVPQDKDYALDLLHFSTFPNAQYEQDKDFLQSILQSLHYDAAKGLLE